MRRFHIVYIPAGLYDHFLFAVVFSELCRRHPFSFFEDTVEVRQVVESAGVADLGNRLRGVDQKADGEAEADVGQEIDEALTGALFDKPAERRFAHIDEGRHVGETDLVLVVAVEVFDDFSDPQVFVFRFVLADKRMAGQRTDVFRKGELVQDHQEFQNGVESVGFAGDSTEQGAYLGDGFRSEDDAFLRAFHQYLDAFELIFLQQVVGDGGGVKL